MEQVRLDPFKMSDPLVFSTNRASKEEGAPFLEILKASMVKVNEVQADADKLTQRLALGEVDDVSEVSIAVEKAELALRMMVQIRDKLVDAYQQIARMSV